MKYFATAVICLLFHFYPFAQPTSAQELRWDLNEEGTSFAKLTFLNQVWLRYTDTNPGSTIYGNPADDVFDIGIRRTRVQLFGHLTEKVFFYTQFGLNNFTYLTPRHTGSFFHDALSEYHFGRSLHLGAGLTGWVGLSRYSSAGVGNQLALDVPLYQFATIGINDQFLRNLSIYAKGKLGKLDYRVSLSKPLAVQNSAPPVGPIGPDAGFSTRSPELQQQGYFMYQFLDEEANVVPYKTGTYLGKKRVFNIGTGFRYQSRAMWNLTASADTSFSDMLLLSLDLFYDTPLNREKGSALTLYGAYSRYDFGPRHLRMSGIMNPANGTGTGGTFTGPGNAFPMVGTGDIVYLQAGYLFGTGFLPGNNRLQPYVASQAADFEKLDDPMIVWEAGFHWFPKGSHAAKFTVHYQDRPVFDVLTSGETKEITRKGMVVMQVQVSI